MKNKKNISREEFMKKVDTFCEVIKNLDTSVSKTDAAEYACYQIITQAAESHYEGLGVLQEVMLSWREESLKALNEECECVDKN